MCTSGEVVQQHGQGDGFIASADSAEMAVQFIRGGGDEVGVTVEIASAWARSAASRPSSVRT